MLRAVPYADWRYDQKHDHGRYREMMTALMGTSTFEEAWARRKLVEAKRLKNGRRRHGSVKHWRDEIRRSRK